MKRVKNIQIAEKDIPFLQNGVLFIAEAHDTLAVGLGVSGEAADVPYLAAYHMLQNGEATAVRDADDGPEAG